MKKIDKRVWWSVPIVLGIYLIFREYSKTTITKKQETIPSGTASTDMGNKPLYSSTYPLKLGSRDSGSPLAPKGLVVNLQRLINTRGYIPSNSPLAPYTKLVEDGLFGAKTQDAVVFWTGNKTIDDESDLEILKSSLVNKLPFTNVTTLF